MRIPKKTTALYEKLKGEILSGKFVPGSQLPPEPEFARELEVGRVTLRTALEKLEAENLVCRIERKGTFVRTRWEQQSVTVLLPCEHYVERSGYGSVMSLQLLLNGAIEGAQKFGAAVKTAIYSQSNTPTDINWRAFENFNADTKVIIIGFWMEPLFQFLLDRKCQVVHVTKENLRPVPQCGGHPAWHRITFDLENCWKAAAGKLRDEGCRKIAFATTFPQEDSGIRQAAESVSGPGVPGFGLNEICTYEELCRFLCAKQKETGFDGLLLNYLHFAHPPVDRFGLPDSVKIKMEMVLRANPPDFAEWFSCSLFDAGVTAAELLCSSGRPQEVHLPLTLEPPRKKTESQKNLFFEI